MTTGGQFLIPGAIVVGFAMLGVAVYHGLTQREAPPPTSSLAASTTAASTLPIATATGVPVNVVEAQARDAVAKEKESLYLPRCWIPLAAKGGPAKSTYSIQLAFAPDGRVIGRGFSEERGKDSRADVAECLRRLPMTISVPPPGVPLQVTVALEFP